MATVTHQRAFRAGTMVPGEVHRWAFTVPGVEAWAAAVSVTAIPFATAGTGYERIRVENVVVLPFVTTFNIDFQIRHIGTRAISGYNIGLAEIAP